MKTRRSVRNQNILWNSIKAETAPTVTVAEPKKNCFNCMHYPKQGRSTMKCHLLNIKVSGLSERDCFVARPTIA